MACVPNLWLYAVIYNIEVKVKHMKDKFNVYAKILSIWHNYQNISILPVRSLKACKWLQPVLTDSQCDIEGTVCALL